MSRIDIDLSWEGDFILTPSGDIRTVDEVSGRIQEKLFRVLFTNPGDLLYHPDYGVGIGSWDGVAFGDPEVEQLQSLIENALIGDPDIKNPVVTVSPVTDSLIQVSVAGDNAYTGQPINFIFGVGGN